MRENSLRRSMWIWFSWSRWPQWPKAGKIKWARNKNGG